MKLELFALGCGPLKNMNARIVSNFTLFWIEVLRVESAKIIQLVERRTCEGVMYMNTHTLCFYVLNKEPVFVTYLVFYNFH